MRSVLFISSLLMLLVSSCKKEEISESYVGPTKFYLKGVFGESELLFEAGKDDYYMFSRKINGDSLFPSQFVSNLRGLNTMGVNGEIEVLIRNSKNYSTQPGDLINLLDSSKFEYYYGDNAEHALMNFLPQYSSPVSSVSWNFGDGSTSSEILPMHYFATNAELSFNVCVTTEYANGCSDEICSDVFLPNNPCKSEIQYVTDSSGGFSTIYSSNVTGTNPIQYTWTFDDSIEVYTAEAKYTYNSSTSKIQHVKLRTYDASGCETNVAIKHPIGSTTDCYTNFRAVFVEYNSILLFGFREVVINYKDKNGKLYSSDLGYQNDQARFEVISHEHYKAKETELNAEAVEIEFSCRLFSSDGDYIDVSSAVGRMFFYE